MEKSDLKHLAFYLPYEVKIRITGAGIDPIMKPYHIGNMLDGLCTHRDFKLILRPLSDLTKEIEHNGEKFIPIEKIANILGGKINAKDKRIIGKAKIALINEIQRGKVQFRVIQKLLEWHFDIYGLIEKKFAINKNEL